MGYNARCMASGSRNIPSRASRASSSVTQLRAGIIAGSAPGRKQRVAVLNWLGVAVMERCYCAELLFYFTDRAADDGIDLEILGAGEGPVGSVPPFPPLEQVLAGKFDGLILNGIWEEPYIGELYKAGVPMVSVEFQPRGSPIDAVTFSGQQGGRLAAKAFLDTGQTSVMVVTRYRKDLALPAGGDPWVEDDTALDRRMGLQNALTGSGVEVWPLLPWMAGERATREMAYKRIQRMLEAAGGPPNVVFATDGDIANEVKAILIKLGHRVPEDIGILTFDSPSLIENSGVSPHTCISYSWREMGRAGWDLLLERMKSRGDRTVPPRHIEIEGSFSDRGSVLTRRRD